MAGFGHVARSRFNTSLRKASYMYEGISSRLYYTIIDTIQCLCPGVVKMEVADVRDNDSGVGAERALSHALGETKHVGEACGRLASISIS